MSNELFNGFGPDDSAFAGLFGKSAPALGPSTLPDLVEITQEGKAMVDEMMAWCGSTPMGKPNSWRDDVMMPVKLGNERYDVITKALLAGDAKPLNALTDSSLLFGVIEAHTATAPTSIDMKGKPILPEIISELRRIAFKNGAPLPPVMQRTEWDELPEERRDGYTMTESPWMPDGLVAVMPDKPTQFGVLGYQSIPKWEPPRGFFSDHSPSLVEVGLMSNYCPPALALYRPGPFIMPIQIPPCPLVPRQFPQLRKKFLYWYSRKQSLQRDEYLSRLAYEGPSVCYHGAIGEDQRFARWRLAFHECVALNDKLDSLKNG